MRSTSSPSPLDPLRKRALIVLVAGTCVWSPFWLWYQFHFHTRFVGPFYTFSFTFLPLTIALGLNVLASAKGKHRAWVIALIVLTTVLTIAFVPVLRVCGVHVSDTP